MTKLAIQLITATIAATMFAGSARAADKGPDALCHDPLLSRQEQTLCVEQMAAARTVPEQKQIQAKFRDRIAKKKQK